MYLQGLCDGDATILCGAARFFAYRCRWFPANLTALAIEWCARDLKKPVEYLSTKQDRAVGAYDKQDRTGQGFIVEGLD